MLNTVLGDLFVPEAADDARPSTAGCMPGTRIQIMTECVTWAIGGLQNIFWLSGMAGTGKSSIALTLCRMLRNEPGVFFGGGFFCSRASGSSARTDVRRILPTLLRLMAGKSPEFATALSAKLGKADRTAFRPVREQMRLLLHQSLSALAPSHRPIVFVIDALDELSREDEVAQLLQHVAEFRSDVPVKFILTSRPELHIRRTPIRNNKHSKILHLDIVNPVDVQHDIRTYIACTLAAVSKTSTWYTDNDVETLVQLADCLFVFASATLNYVLGPDEDDDRSARLRRVTSGGIQGTAATAQIDAMYESVATAAFDLSVIDTEELDQLKFIIAQILISRSLITMQGLAGLVSLSSSSIRRLLRRLHAVVHVPEDDDVSSLRTIHTSFGDYLFNRAPNHISIPLPLVEDDHGHSVCDIVDGKR